MNVTILTEEQTRNIAIEGGKEALALFIKSFLPDFKKSAEPKEEDQQFTPKQLAEYWQCHIETIRLKKRKGEIPFYQVGRKIMFKKSEIDALTANPVFKSGL